MNKQITRYIVLILSLGLFAANGAQTIRELWDNIPEGRLQGATNGTTSFGFSPAAAARWVVNPADPSSTNVLMIRGGNVDDWMIGRYDILPSSSGNSRTVGLVSGNTNGWGSGSWAVRLLDTPSRINTSADGVYYFSARLMKRSLWWGTETNNYGPDDAALGIGFANGSSAASKFIGAGFTRTVAVNGGGGYTNLAGDMDIGDTVYISQGTLGQAGYPDHPTDSGGPYYVSAYGYPQWVTGYLGGYPSMDSKYVNGGFLVGKLTTSAAGNDQLQVYAYVEGETVPMDESSVVWDVTYSFNETVVLSSLLVWMHGNNNANDCFVDAIRVGTTWAEVIGVETVGRPTVSPYNPVYEGTPITLSIVANRQDETETYQWLKDGLPITDATEPTYSITDPIVTDSGAYSVVFSNSYGVAVTSQVQTLTVNLYAAPFVTQQPVSGTRYVGSPGGYTFSVTADGGQPLTYQWKHIVGVVTNALAEQTNRTLVLTDLQASDAGGYLVTVGNLAGSTNSEMAMLNVEVPPAGSYAEAVLSKNPYAYWPLNETSGTNLFDYWGGHTGYVIDSQQTVTNVDNETEPPTTNIYEAGVLLGVPGVAAPGFPQGHTAITIQNNGSASRANLSSFPNYGSPMTWACWVYSPNTVVGYPGNDQGLAFLLNRDRGNNGGYGNAFGLELFPSYVIDGDVTNTFQNQVGYKWGGGAENPEQNFNGYRFTNSNLYLPMNQWTFVAWVVDGAQTSIYVGTNNTPLTVATATLPTVLDANFPNTTYSNNWPIILGRTGWPWADDGGGAGFQTPGVSMSDVVVYTSALSASDINDIYLAALGQAITYTKSGANLLLSWPEGTLQGAPAVNGVYTNIPGATSPDYPIPATGQGGYFRVMR